MPASKARPPGASRRRARVRQLRRSPSPNGVGGGPHRAPPPGLGSSRTNATVTHATRRQELISRRQQEAATLRERAHRPRSQSRRPARNNSRSLRGRPREELQQSQRHPPPPLSLDSKSVAATLPPTSSRLSVSTTDRTQRIAATRAAARRMPAPRSCAAKKRPPQLAVQHSRSSPQTREHRRRRRAHVSAKRPHALRAAHDRARQPASAPCATRPKPCREQRSTLTARAAKLASDIEHIEATCLNDLGVEAADLRADESIARIEGEAARTPRKKSPAPSSSASKPWAPST